MSATPETNRVLRSRLEELLGEYDRVRAALGSARSRTGQVSGQAKSADGGLRVVVGSRGELVGLEIDPRTYRKSAPTELAQAILALCAEAAEDAQKQMAEILRPFLPKDVSLQDLADGAAGLRATPPQPLTDSTFDAWWAGIGSAETDAT